eukprot:SAG31_NODE_29837_length_389_cov_0.720690_1_plen_62_part_10
MHVQYELMTAMRDAIKGQGCYWIKTTATSAAAAVATADSPSATVTPLLAGGGPGGATVWQEP